MVATLWTYSIFLLITVITLLYIYFTRIFKYWKKKNVFYIKPIPFFGNLLPVFSMKQTMGDWLKDLCFEANRDYFGIFVFDQPVLMVTSPKLVKSILQKDFSYFQNRTMAATTKDPIMKNFMFFSNNPEWKAVRAKVSPVFTSGKMKLMFSLILNESNAMTDYIDTMKNIPNIESKEICAKYSTNVIARCAFAVDAQSFHNQDAEFRQIGRRLFDFRYTTALRQLGAWFTPNLISFFNIRFFDSFAFERLKSIFTEVLHSRMASKFLKGNDLVDILLETGQRNNVKDFNENALIGQAIQFFAAGFETVSSSLSFTLYELCIHQEIQKRLRDEILENIEKHNGLTYEGLAEMKYLDMCVSECLRKYPVLPFLDRTCHSDYKLEGTDLVINKGTPVYIPLFALHYDPKVFPDPDKFDPERFTDKSKVNSDGFSYIPFGEGPRACIGNRFGLMGVKLGLASILSRYKLEVTDKTPIPLKFETKSFLLQSTVGIPLKFVPI